MAKPICATCESCSQFYNHFICESREQFTTPKATCPAWQQRQNWPSPIPTLAPWLYIDGDRVAVIEPPTDIH
ncbi:hypothetical protein [Synechococcus elongatus]|uniref:hypothetical protein n=1 Tax=Synechococcus elongatus TaxID=32046 RepID=UPI0030CDD617